MKKSTIIMLVVAIVAVAGTQFGWWRPLQEEHGRRPL
ncbi:MAG: protein YoaJ [Klebsiella pneumoniae]|nr:protein YoaJ [Klebsiella pneumoniae]